MKSYARLPPFVMSKAQYPHTATHHPPHKAASQLPLSKLVDQFHSSPLSDYWHRKAPQRVQCPQEAALRVQGPRL